MLPTAKREDGRKDFGDYKLAPIIETNVHLNHDIDIMIMPKIPKIDVLLLSSNHEMSNKRLVTRHQNNKA